jgi:CubicO group peptidase (beta-lactamase class C family)
VDILGAVIERVSGQTLAEFLKTNLTAPLGMGDTNFYLPKDQRDRPPQGNGGLYSTGPDYARFCQMLLNGGELDGHRLLSPLTVQLMRSNVLPASARTFSPGTGFGLDFAVVEDPVAAGGYGGEGTFYWGGYAGTWFWIDPVYKMIVVGMIQIRGDGSPDVRGLSRNLTYQAIVK